MLNLRRALSQSPQIRSALLIAKVDIRRWSQSKFYIATYAVNLFLMPFSTGLLGIFGSQVSNGLSNYNSNFFGWISSAILLQLTALQISNAIATGARSSGLLFIPVNERAFFVGKTLWAVTLSCLSASIYVTIAVSMFHLQLNVNWITLATALFFALLAQTGIELAGAGYKILYRTGTDPITWTFNFVAGFFAGISYPIMFLPSGMRIISYMLPQTYTYYFWRMAMTRGADGSLIGPSNDLSVGSGTGLPFYPALIGLVSLPTLTFSVGLRYLRRSITRAKKLGFIESAF